MAALPDVHPADYRGRRRAAGVPALRHSVNGGLQKRPALPLPLAFSIAHNTGGAQRAPHAPTPSAELMSGSHEATMFTGVPSAAAWPRCWSTPRGGVHPLTGFISVDGPPPPSPCHAATPNSLPRGYATMPSNLENTAATPHAGMPSNLELHAAMPFGLREPGAARRDAVRPERACGAARRDAVPPERAWSRTPRSRSA